MSQHLLFNDVSVFDVIESQKNGLREAVLHFPSARLDEDDLPNLLASQFGINVPMIQEEKKYARKRPVEIDVSRDPMRGFLYGYGGPHYVQGTEVSIFVPFSGDAGLFHVRPASFDSNPPRGETVGNELCFIYAFVDTINSSEYERTINSVKKYLDWLRPSSLQLRQDLERIAGELVAQRKSRESQQSQALGALGIPIVDDSAVDQVSVRPASARSTKVRGPARRVDTNKWDVFISHASEDKEEVARPLANALQQKGLSVWYDEASLKLGDSLRQKIDHGLSNSQFGAVILSPHFFEKHWPQQELNGLVTREVEGKKVILPVWHNVDFKQVRQHSPVLADRLAVSTSEGLDTVVQKIIDAIRS